jgi:hypothetical protein
MNFIITLLGLFSGLKGFLEKVLAVIISKQNIEQGKILERSEQVVRDAEIKEKQTEILLQDVSVSNTITKMEEGKF